MLYPYGRPPPPRPRCALDAWTGAGWRLLERHELEVPVAPEAALAALDETRIRELPVVRALFALRGVLFSPDETLGTFFSTPPFIRLAEEPGREVVAGILVPPRDAAGRRRVPATRNDFVAALPLTPLCAIATFRAEPSEAGALLWTETWSRTRGSPAAVLFGAYWLAIGPWSAWIRRMFLRAARRRAAHAGSRARVS